MGKVDLTCDTVMSWSTTDCERWTGEGGLRWKLRDLHNMGTACKLTSPSGNSYVKAMEEITELR